MFVGGICVGFPYSEKTSLTRGGLPEGLSRETQHIHAIDQSDRPWFELPHGPPVSPVELGLQEMSGRGNWR